MTGEKVPACPQEENMEDTLVLVSTHRTILEAEMARSLLEASGIGSFIQAPHANALYPGVLGEVGLQVRQKDLERAREVLFGLDVDDLDAV